MFSNIISYFTSPNNDRPIASFDTKRKDSIGDWVFIDSLGHEMSKEAVGELGEHEEAAEDSDIDLKPVVSIFDMNSLESSSAFVDTLSFTNPEDDWCMTPPPCFTLNCPTKLEISPLENLLIEHPSMSVYGLLPCNVPASFNPVKSKSMEISAVVDEEVQTEDNVSESKSQSLPHDSKKQSDENISRGNMLWKNAVISTYDKTKKKKYSVELIGKFKSTEISFSKDRYKLRPSFIRRQNLYTLSQCSLGSRNRFVVKPFGEKCRRSL